MLRSLHTAATGLLGHQVSLDVVGRNISNVNTVAFKRGRATFSSILGGSVAGIQDASPLGSGLLTGEVQDLFMQGELELTGNPLDFAIEGEGFFAISLEGLDYYSRAGACALDSTGRLVHLGSGGTLQGYMADGSGQLRSGSSVGDIALDLEQTLAASATTYLSLGGSLNPDSQALGSVYEGGPFYREAGGSDLLLAMSLAGGGQSLGLGAGDRVTLSGWSGDSYLEPEALEIGESTSLADLAAWLEGALRGADAAYPVGGVQLVEGRILVTGGSQDISELQLEVEGLELLAEALDFPDSIAAGANPLMGASPGRLLVAAQQTTLMTDLYGRSGDPLNGPDSELHLLGESLALGATVSGLEQSEEFEIVPTTTLDDFMEALESLTETGSSGVELDGEGRITIRGASGLSHGIADLSVQAEDGSPDLGGIFHFSETQGARDAIPRETSSSYVDAQGQVHQINLRFELGTDASGENLWTWTASVDGGAEIRAGGSGTLRFDAEGVPELSFADGRGSLELAGSEDGPSQSLELRLDADSPLLERNSGTSLGIMSHDGEEGGSLEDLQVDEEGIITGLFSNGQERTLAQIALANFRNADGLSHEGENLYSESSPSGRPLWRGSDDGTKVNRISVGSLELSNVDLAQEFATMITTQKGFQANAKIVKIGDEMLSTASRLKR